MSLRGIDTAFEQVREAGGLPSDLGLHPLRRSYITHLVEFDYPERFVSEQAGHRYASTASIYTNVSDDFGDAFGPDQEPGFGEGVPLPQQRLRCGGRAGVDDPHRRLLEERGSEPPSACRKILSSIRARKRPPGSRVSSPDVRFPGPSEAGSTACREIT
ncbi:tyrosine-type recombinase/integrase [Streptosporangium roseum]|uniref:tyrosine-type recombinase/integrase n=1 Tax=Streptosporangium roseum TaxID=2001 RepID=UPI0034207A2C